MPKIGKALDKAIIKHGAKQIASIGQSNSSVSKPLTKEEPLTNKPINIEFDIFWNLYDKKVSKDKCENKWNKLTDNERQLAIDFIPKYKLSQPNKKYRKNPETFLNNKSWNDEIINNETNRTNNTRGFESDTTRETIEHVENNFK